MLNSRSLPADRARCPNLLCGRPIVAAAICIIIWLPCRASWATERVIVFGDSWGVFSALALEQTFDAHGLGIDVFGAAVPGEEAADMARLRFPYISFMLAAHPTADLVHLSIGGNDLRSEWDASLSNADEDALLDRITDNIETVVRHILAQRSHAEVFYSSYDYLRPIDLGTPLEVNTVMEELHNRVEQRLSALPQVTTHQFYGLMQTLYGYSPTGIPPGDPSLPDIRLPGPPEAFVDDIHLTFLGPNNGYDRLAEAQFAAFYRARLVPEAATWGLLICGASLFVARRFRYQCSRTAFATPAC